MEWDSVRTVNDSGDRQGRPWSAGASAARPRFRTWNSVRQPGSLRSKSAVAARALPAQSMELVSAGGLVDNRMSRVPPFPSPPLHSEWKGGSGDCGSVTQGGPRVARLPWATIGRPYQGLRQAPSDAAGPHEAGVVGGRTKSAVAANALPAQSKEWDSVRTVNDSGDRQGRPWSAGASAARPRFRTWNSVRRPGSLRSKSAVAINRFSCVQPETRLDNFSSE